MDTALIMATRERGADTEAEPIVVESDENVVVLTLDDGEKLRMDRTELRAAIDDDHRQAA